MAKTCMIARERRRVKLSDKSKPKRRELKIIVNDAEASYDDKMTAVIQLNKRHRNESPSRIQKRCRSCGRPRAVYRKFGLCRICLREAAMRGEVPGLVKASW